MKSKEQLRDVHNKKRVPCYSWVF